jgi:acyl-CoA synthetase (AMP-forming)/AMP-acid ligase II
VSPGPPAPGAQGRDPGGLAEVVREAGRRHGDTTLYVTAGGARISYRQLDAFSEALAAGLVRRGVREGDVVALVLPSGPAYVACYAAAAKLGAVTAGVNERLAPPERGACLAVAAPRLVIGTPELLEGTGAGDLAEVAEVPVVEAEDRRSPGAGGASAPGTPGAFDALSDLADPEGAVPALEPDPQRPVAIVFTSGTTGTPKGAVYAGRQLDAVSEADAGRRWGGGGRTLASTSFAHLGTMSKLPQVLRGGGTSVVMGRWSPGEALRLVEQHRITSLGGIPTQVALMLRHERFGATDLSSVALVALGGGPCTPALVRQARAGFPCPVVVRYTCTEAGVGTGTSPEDPDEDAELTVGRPRPGVTVSVRDERGEPLEVGEVGEVCLASAATMSGYWRDPRATEEVFTADGAVRTGDLGFLDERGRLHLAGRAKEMYVRGGYNVFPQEVEAVLEDHPDLAQVAVVPRDDPVMGEVGVAVVVPRRGRPAPTLEQLRRFAEGRLAHHKLPEALVVSDDLPRTAMEKVDRRALARLVASEAGAEVSRPGARASAARGPEGARPG